MPDILLIEDNAGDARLIREMYRDADLIDEVFTITHVTRIGDAIKKISDGERFDLVLSDMSLPDSQGLETLQSLTDVASQLPVIFMTGTNDMAFVTAAIKAGAQDYLVKGAIDSQVLVRATHYAIERKRAQVSYESALKKADALAVSRDELKRQRHDLLQLNRAKDEFISLSSHQLRTPATGVKQYLGMILDGFVGPVPEELTVFIRTAYESNERQLNIINDLLKTARLDSGRYELERNPTDICELVNTIIEEYRPIISMRNQTVSFSNSGDCKAEVDEAEMRIAIANLVENASKYSPEGGSIKANVNQRGNKIDITITDDGVGIAAKDLVKIFDKFTRVDNSLSDTVSGSGLGLYFVERITRMHGGSIKVQSRSGEGSTFIISLPHA